MLRAMRRIVFFLLALLCLAWSTQARLLTPFFPEGVPGYGTAPGVTVKSRTRPDFEPLGFRLDTVTIAPALSESLGYDSNIFGGPSRRGGWLVRTSPSVLLGTQRSGVGTGLFFSADDIRYPGQPSQDRTDGSAFAGTTIDIGRGKLTLGGGWLARHQDRSGLDALLTDKPVGYQVQNARAAFTIPVGRFTWTPSVDLNRWRFDNTTILGVPSSQRTRDRTTVQGGLTIQYDWMPGRSLLWVSRLLDSHYDHPAAGVPSNNAQSWQGLGGVEYDDNAVWRYRLLGGVQYRLPAAGAIRSQVTGIAEAELVWSPSGMTIVHASLLREIEDAALTGLSNVTYTSGTVAVDHELLRNVLFSGSAGVRHARFNQSGGQQIGLTAGAGATWLIDRHVQLSLTADVADIRNRGLPAGSIAGNYTRTLSLLTLRLAL